jgi:spore germination protein YaaH
MTNFVRDLKTKLNTVNSNYSIYMAISADYQHDDQIFDIGVLQNYTDYIMMMGYDYHIGNIAGSNAPIDYYNSDPSIRDATTHYASLMNKSKLLLGVPWYGYEWSTQTGDLLSPKTGEGMTYSYPVMVQRAAQYGRIWDSTWKTPWYRYQNGTQWYQGHYDDTESLGIKYDLVNSQGLAGIGIWELGYGDDRPELWQLIKDKFGK